MSDVYYLRGTYQDFLQEPERILAALQKTGFLEKLTPKTMTGLKVHFGEKGNTSHINPRFLTPIAKHLKENHVPSFLFETNTLYRGDRMNSVSHITLAREHGFGKPGLPIIIGDGLKGNDYTEVGIYQNHFQTCYVALALEDISNLIVLSHFTGHMLTGFGASIKNIGMGCASRRGKLAQHSIVSPKITPGKCVLCGACADNCPADAIEKREESFFINSEKCIGCAQCISVCPHGAVQIIWSEAFEDMGEKMVEYALAVSRKVKCVYVNFCLFMTKECDCMNREESGFIPDLGVLVSNDPVSIDKAAIDLILEREGKDVLNEVHPKVDYSHHLQYAQKLGLGSQEYSLIEV